MRRLCNFFLVMKVKCVEDLYNCCWNGSFVSFYYLSRVILPVRIINVLIIGLILG